jgi:chaperonin GroES
MKKVHIDPLSDRVVVMPEEADEKTASGIILPDTAKEKPQMGKILAAGPGKVSENGNVVKMTLKAGDKVLYGKYSGTEITLDSTDVLIMRESDILAKFNK